MHGFSLGGKTDDELGVTMLKKSERELAPETRGKAIKIPGRPGAYVQNEDIGPRRFELKLEFTDATSRSDLESYVRDFTTHLLDNQGKPRELELIFDDEPGKTYYVFYSGRVPLRRRINTATFTLPLIAYDPFAYEDEETVTQSISSSPEQIELLNSGNVNTPFTIKITNNGDAPIDGLEIELL